MSRGRLSPPETAFEAVLPQAVQVLLRSAVLAKLVTVCAPSGYGKTLVLGRLYRTLLQRGVRCVWLTLDDRDTQVDAVLSLLATALDQETELPARGGGLFDALPIDPRESTDRLLTLLGGLDSTTVLFIDNLHVCTDPQLGAVLDRLVFGSELTLRLAISSTQELPLDLVRAKLELSTVELEARHLALDAESLRCLLLQAGLNEPTPTVLARIHELTEGWPVASRLLQVLMSQDASPEQVVARFSGADHDMAAVLTRRVISGFPVRQVEFLMQVALLREFSEELAANATGCPEAGQWLDEMLRRNVLIFPLDRNRRWLRMHTLLRQYLLAEGTRRLSREARKSVLERAAHWHAEQGDAQAALEAALAAPVPTLAGQLLDRVARTVAGNQGQLALFVKWAEQVLATGVALSPEAHAWYVWSLCFSLQYERAFNALQSLDHRLAEIDPGGQRAIALGSRLGLLRVVIAIHLDILNTASEDAQRWLQAPLERDPLGVATVATGAAVAELARGRPEQARRHMHTAEGAIGRSDSAYGRGWVALIGAAIDLTEGDPVQADRRLVQTRPLVVAQLGEDAAVSATMDFVHARALHDLGRLSEARAKALKGLMTACTHGVNETAQHGLAACVALWDGLPEGEFSPTTLDRVVRCYAPRTQRQVAMHQVRRLLHLRRTEEAKEFAHRNMLDPDAEGVPDGPVGLQTMLALEWALLVGKNQGLHERIERHIKQACVEQNWRERLQLHLLEIDIHVQGGNLPRARRALAQALFVAARRRLVQPLFDRLAQLERVLSSTSIKDFGLVQSDEIELFRQLKDRLGDAPQTEPSNAPQGLTEPLTRREHELLDLLEKGLSNQQIADRVHLSVPTVKWHFYKLFAKLQVKNRAAALVKARALSLLR